MKVKLIFIGLMLVALHSNGQRLSTGFNLGTTPYFHVELNDNFVFPEHSYFTYWTYNEKKDYRPEFQQFLNGLNAGLNVNLDYKRWMFTTEFTLATNKIKLDLLYPSPLGSQLDDSWSTFVVQKTSFNIPVLLTYKLSRKSNGLFVTGGMQYSFNSYDEANQGLDSEISDAIYIFISETEMYGILYNEFNFTSLLAGIGYKKDNNYYSVRFNQRIGGDLSKYPDARYYQVDFQYSKLLNFQRLKKGYHLYQN